MGHLFVVTGEYCDVNGTWPVETRSSHCERFCFGNPAQPEELCTGRPAQNRVI